MGDCTLPTRLLFPVFGVTLLSRKVFTAMNASDRQPAGSLRSKVAVVTGASRGAGRGIALALGEAGATVYVTGRSVRGRATTENLPGTIEDTAETVAARGGTGIAVRCDHT